MRFYINIYLLLLAASCCMSQNRNVSERAVDPLGPAEGDLSRITIKNSIVYHFMKNVKSIESDIFVSRRIDIGPLTQGISEIAGVADRVSSLCAEIPSLVKKAKIKVEEEIKKTLDLELNKPKFQFLAIAGKAPHTEARQRCRAQGLSLPEIYTHSEYNEFIQFLDKHQIGSAHAGIYFDEEYSIQRFYSTGMPAASIPEIYIYLETSQLSAN